MSPELRAALAKSLQLLDELAGERFGIKIADDSVVFAHHCCEELAEALGIEVKPGWSDIAAHMIAPPINPATHSPGGEPHPDFILDYFAAFRARYPKMPLPELWDRGNGWVQFSGRSARKSEIIALTKRGRGEA